MAQRRSWPWSDAPADEQGRRRLAERRAGIEAFVRLRRLWPDDPDHRRFVAAFDVLVAGTDHDDAMFCDAAEIALDRLGALDAADRFIADMHRTETHHDDT